MADDFKTNFADPQLQKELAARLQYYRDMGIYDLYRRKSAGGAGGDGLSAVSTEECRDSAVLPVLNTTIDVEAELRAIREDIGDCTRCGLHKGRKNIVFGVGNPHAELMFVGEGPGADEDAKGEPFVGRAGQLLNKMIEAMGVQRADVYIANVVKCRPPDNRTPERDEMETCSPFLYRQIAAIQPKVIVALGATATKALLNVNEPMSALRGRWHAFRGTKLIATYHPAYLLRDPRQKGEAWKDLQMAMKELALEPPPKNIA
ncbi:MAG: uracil-DNA glycosylase [Candidatus Koribacter versatilis]|uniref:Type-4 uracil-DNA glycosylase n=1 Tax=Candidatus Korobacter versatilis TaxID=658062 RepID=A0A932EQG6_9BACT|nr:uracil-DNA glycosylase [Candidatus Koribacter versatilis]